MLIQSIPYRDPLAVCEAFSDESHLAFLDSSAEQDGKGRFSYVAADPFRVIEATASGVFINGRKNIRNPFDVLKDELSFFSIQDTASPVPFCGGAIGYFGYELGGWLERLPQPRPDAFLLPTLVIGFYDVITAFDHQTQQAWLLSSGFPEKDSALRNDRAAARARHFAKKLLSVAENPSALNWSFESDWSADSSRLEVERSIANIISYIYSGDIFQANFSQRFQANRPDGLSDFMLYRRLRALSPAPFASFLRAGPRLSILSASPERFLRYQAGGLVTAQPIKGTRRRDLDPARDLTLARELELSSKDRAENLMIVDLMRNDLSRVCQPGSVHVPHLCQLETFATVHHLTSTVIGRLRPKADAVDLLRACFPGGSVTGAPKIRAMEIIHECEPAPRGAYCGCLGWIGFDGAMDMSMIIRTLTLVGNTILAQAGGGVVADSDPTNEYEETMIKIAPLLQALEGPRL